MDTIRTVVAWTAVWGAFGIFVAYCWYGFYIGWKLLPYATTAEPPKDRKWDPAYYAPGAEPWLARRAWHERHFTRVWLGCIVGGNLLYWLAKP